jgi:hypothetical protein
MSINISNTRLSSDDILNELIFQSLDRILGESCHVISRDLPFTGGRSILALDNRKRPALIVFDRQDGGQALLTGLQALESIDTHRAWLLRLYPELVNNEHHALRPEDIQLYILAPTLPPGIPFLKHGFSQLHSLTFQALLINGETGLLIKPAADTIIQPPAKEKTTPREPFRTGITAMEKSEDDYFRNLNIMA